MRVRRVVSLTTLVSFVFLAGTGIMLFLSPQGRVAHWSGWRIFGLSKEQYGAVHTSFTVLFVAAVIWHLVFNWRPILAYLRDRTRKGVKVFTPELSLALLLGGLFFAGPLAGWFPFRQFLDAGDAVKDYWETTSGSPPWGRAELSPLARFFRGMEDAERLQHRRPVTIDNDEALAALRRAGIEVEGESQPLIEVAHANSTTPQALAEIILTAARPRALEASETQGGEESAPFVMPHSRLGRLTLRQYADSYGADLGLALSILSREGMDLDPDERLRDEALRFQTDPKGIIELLNERARPTSG